MQFQIWQVDDVHFQCGTGHVEARAFTLASLAAVVLARSVRVVRTALVRRWLLMLGACSRIIRKHRYLGVFGRHCRQWRRMPKFTDN